MNIIIGMGSNQDYRGRNSIEILDYAKKKMCKVRIDIIAESEYFTSLAYPNGSDPIFINSVLLAEYSGSPEELLFELQGIENYFGRVIINKAGHWVQQEKPTETFKEIISFLYKVT